MATACERFNVTIDELLNELSCIFDDLHRNGLIEEDGSFMEVVALLLQTWRGEELINYFCENHSAWGDCYKREVSFMLKDFSALFNPEFACVFNKLQVPAKIYQEGRGLCADDIDTVFDFLCALAKHACLHVKTKREKQASFLSHFPLEMYERNFSS